MNIYNRYLKHKKHNTSYQMLKSQSFPNFNYPVNIDNIQNQYFLSPHNYLDLDLDYDIRHLFTNKIINISFIDLILHDKSKYTKILLDEYNYFINNYYTIDPNSYNSPLLLSLMHELECINITMLLKILSLPNIYQHLGDYNSEEIPTILSQIYVNELDELKNFIINKNNDSYARWNVLYAIQYIMYNNKCNIKDIHEFTKQFFDNIILNQSKYIEDRPNSENKSAFLCGFIDICKQHQFTDLLPQIELFFDRNLIQSNQMGSFDRIKKSVISGFEYNDNVIKPIHWYLKSDIYGVIVRWYKNITEKKFSYKLKSKL
jgi:hypothetical protein